VVLCDLVALVYDRNDKDAVGYSLHTSICGWPGVITKWKLLGKLGFLQKKKKTKKARNQIKKKQALKKQ